MGDGFPGDPSLEVWVMTLSTALGDLRIVGNYVGRPDQPKHERLYFVRLLASHLREAVKVIDQDADKPHLGQFIAKLPEEAHEARNSIATALQTKLREGDDRTLLDDLKRLRNDTFHYAGDSDS